MDKKTGSRIRDHKRDTIRIPREGLDGVWAFHCINNFYLKTSQKSNVGFGNTWQSYTHVMFTHNFNECPTFSFLQNSHCLAQLALSYESTRSIVAELVRAFLQTQVLLPQSGTPVKHQTGTPFHGYVHLQRYSLEPLFPSCFELQQRLKDLFFSPHHNHLGSFGQDLYIQPGIHHSVLTGITKR